MEKQPIDDLFHRKLHNADVTPGADVFARLQSRMNTTPLPVEAPKRRLAPWWYGAAAACLLLTLAWAYQWRNVPSDAPRRNADRLAKQVAPKPRLNEPPGRPAIDLPKPKSASVPSTVYPSEPTQLVRIEKRGFSTEPANPTNQRTQLTRQQDPVQPAEIQPVEAVALRPRSDERIAAPELTQTNPVAARPSPADRQPIAERVVVMTINVPEQANAPATEAVAKAAIQPATSAQPSWSQLVAKVKQLKNGELLARATPPKPATEPRTGISRLFSNVKESLRNENTLEP